MDELVGIFDQLRDENNGEELSNELKDKFLKQIDCEQDNEGYYLTAFGERISFNGIRQLKKPYTKLSLNEIQQNEILKCHQDYFYFRRNYCKILTKSGIGRPEPRQYQERLENELISGDDVIVHFGRQSGKTITVSTFLVWKAMFCENENIGIAANVQKLAVEVLDKCRKIIIELPIWMVPGIISWNRQSIEFDNGMKILTSATSGDSFRGYSIHTLYVDECNHEEETITIRNKKTGLIEDIKFNDFERRLNEENFKNI
jgi:hypothetical protein